MKKVYFKTFGCRTNKFDTEAMQTALKTHQNTNNIEEAAVIVVNSCTVTNGADSDVRNFIRKIKRNFPDKKIIFTGCGYEKNWQNLSQQNLIDKAFNPSFKTQIDAILTDEKLQEKSPKEFISGEFGLKKSFVKIQEGCDFDCSYCIIPSVRGRARSFARKDIVNQVQSLCAKGLSEIVLTGTNIGSYGKKTGDNLADLISELSQIEKLKRIRLGSIEPSQVNTKLIKSIKNGKGDRYLHVAIQHVDDYLLKLMKRKNRFEKDLELFLELSQNGFSIGTDFIVGFPYENDEIWQKSIEKINSLPLTHIHTFIYSKRENTVAANLKELVKGDIAKERQKELIEIINQKNLTFRQAIKEPLLVLIEKQTKQENTFVSNGYCQFYNKIEISSKTPLNNWELIKDIKINKEKSMAFL